ncbi:MAG: phosphatase PAP2 family protein [Algoriphagus sp.]|nr:phosphatase PAP2 family protein [Algoriphagus sp.]
MKKLIARMIHRSQKLAGLGGLVFGLLIFLALPGCYPELQTVPVRRNMTWEQGENLKDSPEIMLKWNHQIQKAYTFYLGGPGLSPPLVSRLFAIYHVAMHDALNSVDPRYETYASEVEDKNADPNAAMIQAVYDVLTALGPTTGPHKTSIDSLYTATMGEVKKGDKKERGIALGKAVAESLLAKRSADVPFIKLVGFNPTPPSGTVPGVFKYIAPLNYALAGFHLQQTWVINSADQFRPDPPYPVNSPEYTADYNEVKSLGAINSTEVTQDQRSLGIFWAENSSRGLNNVAREVMFSNSKYYNVWEMARLFALLHIAIADSYIAVFDSKIHFNYWRPISAIRTADADGNDDTIGDPAWNSVIATPPVGEYPSAHAISGAAAGGILINFLGKSNIPFTTDSGYFPGTNTRSFTDITDAVRENSLSRIYIGYHFRLAVEVGEQSGYELADFVFQNGLKRK